MQNAIHPLVPLFHGASATKSRSKTNAWMPLTRAPHIPSCPTTWVPCIQDNGHIDQDAHLVERAASHKELFCRVGCTRGELTCFVVDSSKYSQIPKIVAATTIRASPIARLSACPLLPVTRSDTTRRARPVMEIATPWRIESIRTLCQAKNDAYQHLRPVVLCSHIYPTSKQAHWDSPSSKEVSSDKQSKVNTLRVE